MNPQIRGGAGTEQLQGSIGGSAIRHDDLVRKAGTREDRIEESADRRGFVSDGGDDGDRLQISGRSRRESARYQPPGRVSQIAYDARSH